VAPFSGCEENNPPSDLTGDSAVANDKPAHDGRLERFVDDPAGRSKPVQIGFREYQWSERRTPLWCLAATTKEENAFLAATLRKTSSNNNYECGSTYQAGGYDTSLSVSAIT
jgi:hypothetical protein